MIYACGSIYALSFRSDINMDQHFPKHVLKILETTLRNNHHFVRKGFHPLETKTTIENNVFRHIVISRSFLKETTLSIPFVVTMLRTYGICFHFYSILVRIF